MSRIDGRTWTPAGALEALAKTDAGDALFVRAGIVHRFEDFAADFATWVFFYGPEGGE